MILLTSTTLDYWWDLRIIVNRDFLVPVKIALKRTQMIGVKIKEDQEQLNPGAHERLGMVRSGLLRVKFDNLG